MEPEGERAMRLVVRGSILCAVLLTGPAWADDTHYRDYPLGGRAVGLGGAFTGLADDPSGIYYNPAGLVDVRQGNVQISTNLYGFEVADTFLAAVDRVTDFDTVVTELNIIPSSASFTSSLQTDEATGRSITTYGLGVFVPSYRNTSARTLSDLAPIGGLPGCDRLAYQRTLLDRTFWFGGAIAHRLDDTWSVGASGFLAYRTLRDQESTTCSVGDASSSTTFATAETNVNLAVAAFILSFGIKADLGDGWTLGLTVTSPSIRAFDYADLRVTRTSADPQQGQSEFFQRELDDLSANTKYGTGIRLGGAYVLERSSTFTADLDFYAGTSYELFRIPADQREVRDALTLTSRIERNPVLNLAIGAEHLLLPKLSVSGGLFTNFTSAPQIPGEVGDSFASDRLPSVHAFGAATVVGWFTEHTLTRIGLVMSYGDGSDVVPRYAGINALGAQTDFVKVDYSRLFAFAFVSSTVRF